MKTKEKSVVVEVKVGESKRLRRLSYPIADSDGSLMTNRLRRLIAGKLGRSESDEEREIHFMGMVWNPPYTILQELAAERLLLQRQLQLMGDRSKLATASPLLAPERAANEEITEMVSRELWLREQMKAKIQQRKAIVQANNTF